MTLAEVAVVAGKAGAVVAAAAGAIVAAGLVAAADGVDGSGGEHESTRLATAASRADLQIAFQTIRDTCFLSCSPPRLWQQPGRKTAGRPPRGDA